MDTEKAMEEMVNVNTKREIREDDKDMKNEEQETSNNKADDMPRIHRHISSQIISSFDKIDKSGMLLTLSSGLSSKMINNNHELIKDRLFTINYRCCIVIFISLGIIYCDYKYISSWYITATFLLIAIIILAAGIFCEIRNRKIVDQMKQDPDKKIIPWYYVTSMKHERKDIKWKIFHAFDAQYSGWIALQEVKAKEGNIKTGKHRYKYFTYDNAMNWFLDIRNTMGIMDHRIGWMLPIIGILLLFGETMIHFYYGHTPIGSFCQSIMIEHGYKYGECLIKDEWGQTLGILCLVCGTLGLLTIRDLTPFAIEEINKAQQYLKEKYFQVGNAHENYDPYYEALRLNRNRKAKLTSKTFIICFSLFVILLSLHAVWFQLFVEYEKPFVELRKIKNRTNDNDLYVFLIVFYIYNAFVFGFAFCLWYIMVYWMYLPFADYFYIVSALSNPINIAKTQRIRIIEKWWVLRKFYHDYVMPVYYGWGEINFFSLLVGSIISWAVLLIWATKSGFVFGYNEVVVLTVGITWPIVIFGCSYKISGSDRKLKHSALLSMEKINLIFYKEDKLHEFNQKQLENQEKIISLIDVLIGSIHSYEQPLKIMGVYMTNEKMAAFFVYIFGMILAVSFELLA